jgi:hypothetical protein
MRIYRGEMELCRISESTTEVDRTANIEGGRDSVPLEDIARQLIQRAGAVGASGRACPRKDLEPLERALGTSLPDWYVTLFCEHALVGLELGRHEPDDDDIIWLEWSAPAGLISESIDCFPGRAILSQGYINVASCSHGSGDPYFVALSAGPDPPLYQIDHEAGDEAEAILSYGLELVAPSLSQFFEAAIVDPAAA